MNKGERDELIVQLKLVELRDNCHSLKEFGNINSIKFQNEYKSLPKKLNLDNVVKLSDFELIKIAKDCGIIKAGSHSKADTIINGESISVKSKKHSPPAIVNHTTRPGFEFAAKHSGGEIEKLDLLIENYWQNRLANLIGEDVKNTSIHSPFKEEKEIMRPFLNYFLFDGTGSQLSKIPANRILGFSDPLNVNTWIIYDRENAIDMYWDNLIFSIRSKKGMPKNYPNVTHKNTIPLMPSIERWTRFVNDAYRGALHIRTR